MTGTVAHASVRPVTSLDLLSQREMASLANTDEEVHQLFRRCALAILSTGVDVDDVGEVLQRYNDFTIQVIAESGGLRLDMHNAPEQAFVDGQMIRGVCSNLFSALRDIVFFHHKLVRQGRFDLDTGPGITDAVFRILRNANVVRSDAAPNLVVCWGGHSISRVEYEYTKEVGYQMGLRGFNIATGCGPGAMKGPMKGAAIAHGKQFNPDPRFIGISEPSIIAAEAPNALVNELVILPDIEKRLEAFVRLAHGVVIFPGGVGTLEELLYLLGVKLHQANAERPLPLLLAAAQSSANYFEQIDDFLVTILGPQVRDHYEVIIGDAVAVARRTRQLLEEVSRWREAQRESFSFDWGLHIEAELQQPFHPDHAAMAALQLTRQQPSHQLIAELRRAFSGITAGNIKDFGIAAVREFGPYQLHGDADIVGPLEALLKSFVEQGRMRLDSSNYTPCFELAGGA